MALYLCHKSPGRSAGRLWHDMASTSNRRRAFLILYMIRIDKWLTVILLCVLAGCALLAKNSGNRTAQHPERNKGRPLKHPLGSVQTTPRPTPVTARTTPEPTPEGSRPPRPPETISKHEFEQLSSQRNEQTKNRAQITSFVDGLKRIANDTSITEARKQLIFSEIIANSKLTGKVAPDAEALNSYYQDTGTSAADRRALDTSLALALSRMPRQP
jgi:hypothetical protein